jgi:hypothetical protein
VLKYILVLAACGRHVYQVRRCPFTLELLISSDHVPDFHYTNLRELSLNFNPTRPNFIQIYLLLSSARAHNRLLISLTNPSASSSSRKSLDREDSSIDVSASWQHHPSPQGLTDKPSRPSTCIDDSAVTIRQVYARTTCYCSSFSAMARTPIVCSRGVRLQDPSWM